MFRGVTDLNMSFLRNGSFLAMVSHHAFKPIGVCTTHGEFTPSHVSPLRAGDAQAAMLVKTKAAAKATDVYVHENPWHSVGMAASIGVVVGLLIGRR
jgi:hypothetical protein